ncbi:hypothetical protein U9M48_044062 [Paspalum notatum var. saurae]|uniref:Uncharacterized protein n=1 Tax=Paspalum notatum var. saurae TaxID=547442 RepID=A0AAQ3UU40_PASNO
MPKRGGRGDVSTGLRTLGLHYLGEVSEDAQALSAQLNPGVERWGRHREFAMHRLLEAKRWLWVAVFERRSDDAAPCFAEVAERSVSSTWPPHCCCAGVRAKAAMASQPPQARRTVL